MGHPISRASAFPVPAEGTLGPAMQALSENRRCFVVAMLETGGQNHAHAAYMAGYGKDTEVARVSACRMMRDPSVLAAIREEADRRLRSGAILGASVLMEIASNQMHKDRLKAAESLLNRSGLVVEQTHRVIHEDNRSDDELKRAVIAMAMKYGMDPAKLLGDDTKKVAAIDGEFVEVELTGAEGLEDLLG